MNVPFRGLLVVCGAALVVSSVAAQEDAASSAPTGASPDAAPVPAEAPPAQATDPGVAPAVEPSGGGETSIPSEAPVAAQNGQISAERIAYDGATIVAQGSEEAPVKFQTGNLQLQAREVRLNTESLQLEASGDVRLERESEVEFRELRPRNLTDRFSLRRVRETAVGQNLRLDGQNRTGSIEDVRLELAQLSLRAERVNFEGDTYVARNVTVRPGGLTEEERRIYGTPPLSLRARQFTVSRDDQGATQLAARGAGLYVGSTRILPVPSYVLRRGSSEEGAYSLTPTVSFNSADRFFVSTRLTFPFDREDPTRLAAFADLGLSARVGIRGGVGVLAERGAGDFQLALRLNDVVTTQLTNRLEVDKLPEFIFRSEPFFTFNLPGNRRAGFAFEGRAGDYTENVVDGSRRASSTRLRGQLVFTTRLRPLDGRLTDGPFLRLFASTSAYGEADDTYNSLGYEIGYDGNLLPRVRGQISLRVSSISGETPFLFDRVEIRREARATVDISLSPRYIVPLDLRYDLSQNRLRDSTIGLLRSYKTFAYGITYQSARSDLRLEVRSGF